MNCPTCKETKLVMSERSGIEIDYCPECRGVWLDRGELDKLIAAGRPERRDDDREYSQSKYSHKYPKRKSFLEEIFD